MKNPILVLALMAAFVAGATAWYTKDGGAIRIADVVRGQARHRLPPVVLGLPEEKASRAAAAPDDAADDSAVGGVDPLEVGIGFVVTILQGMMTSPIPALNIPTLDPFVLTDKDISVEKENIATVHGKVTSVRVEGLSTFVLENVKLYLASRELSLALSIPSMSAEADVVLNEGSIVSPLNVPLDGGFTVRIEATEAMTVNLDLKLAASGDILDIENLELTPNFDAAHVTIGHTGNTGLFVDNAHLDEVITRIVADLQHRVITDWLPVGVKLGVKELNKLLTKLQSPYEEKPSPNP